MLHSNPKLVHLWEVQKDEINGILNGPIQNIRILNLLEAIRKNISSALQQIIPQEKATKRMLNSSTHFHKITENISSGEFIGLDVDQSNGDQEIHPWHDASSVLDQFVQVRNLAAFSELVEQKLLQVAQFVANGHVKLVITLGGQKRGT